MHQFISGASGLAVLVAVGRALKRATVKTIGNFWVDLTRGTALLRHPACRCSGPFRWPGRACPQTWKPYPTANLMEPYTTQVQKTDDKGSR